MWRRGRRCWPGSMRSAGFQDDGHGSARTWLRWQTQVTGGAAAGAVGWVRRLAAHPAVRDALAAGGVSPSWAREICDWSDLLPAGSRGDCDVILLGAAAGGADLADLAGLAQEMRRRLARPIRTAQRTGSMTGRCGWPLTTAVPGSWTVT
jgi:hypothetical protein